MTHSLDDVEGAAQIEEQEKHKTLAERLYSLMRVLVFLVIILIVVALGNLFLTDDLSDSVDKVGDAATLSSTTSAEARTAAVEARDELRKAIASVNENGQSSNSEAVRGALAAIARIENYLCGGPCG